MSGSCSNALRGCFRGILGAIPELGASGRRHFARGLTLVGRSEPRSNFGTGLLDYLLANSTVFLSFYALMCAENSFAFPITTLRFVAEDYPSVNIEMP